MAAELAYMQASKVAKASGALRYLNRAGSKVARLADSAPREVVDDIFSCALKKQTGGEAFFNMTAVSYQRYEFKEHVPRWRAEFLPSKQALFDMYKSFAF